MDWLSLLVVTVKGVTFDEVLTVTHRATKIVHLLPTRATMNAVQTAELFFQQVVRHHGLPSSIVSDRDPIFTSDVWTHLCDQMQIKQCCTAPFHPQANGQAERTNQTMKQVLRALLASRPQQDWVSVLYMVEVAINNAPIATTEFSPYFLNYGFHPVFQWDVPPTDTRLPETQRLEPLRQFLSRMKENWKAVNNVFEDLKHKAAIQANKRRTDYQFTVGQQVLVSQKEHYRSQLGPSGPLAPRAAGPFVIIKRITRNTFVLDIPASVLGRASPVFHSSDLIPYESRLLEPEAGVDPPDYDIEAQEEVAEAEQLESVQGETIPLLPEPLREEDSNEEVWLPEEQDVNTNDVNDVNADKQTVHI